MSHDLAEHCEFIQQVMLEMKEWDRLPASWWNCVCVHMNTCLVSPAPESLVTLCVD